MFRRASLYKQTDIVLEMRRKFHQHGVAGVLSVAVYEVVNHASCNQNAINATNMTALRPIHRLLVTIVCIRLINMWVAPCARRRW